jgi:hypothetical protein
MRRHVGFAGHVPLMLDDQFAKQIGIDAMRQRQAR